MTTTSTKTISVGKLCYRKALWTEKLQIDAHMLSLRGSLCLLPVSLIASLSLSLSLPTALPPSHAPRAGTPSEQWVQGQHLHDACSEQVEEPPMFAPMFESGAGIR